MFDFAGGDFVGVTDGLGPAAEGADAVGVVAVFEPALEVAVATPEAGDAPGDAAFAGDLGKAGAVKWRR